MLLVFFSQLVKPRAYHILLQVVERGLTQEVYASNVKHALDLQKQVTTGNDGGGQKKVVQINLYQHRQIDKTILFNNSCKVKFLQEKYVITPQLPTVSRAVTIHHGIDVFAVIHCLLQ